MTTHELKRRFPKASAAFISANCSDGQVSNTKPECDQTPALGGNSIHPIWTSQEDFVITCYYKWHPKGAEFTVAPLLAVLNRSEAAIHCRANQLGITFERGKQPRKTPKLITSEAKYSPEERKVVRSERLKERHKTIGHPMLGLPVSNETRQKISDANKGRVMSREEILKRLKTKASNGTLAPNRPHGSWKSGWRTIGGKKLYARSRWEANYCRYLEFLKCRKEIVEWEHEPETFWFEAIRRGSRSYLPDFRVTCLGGTIEYHEVKGWMDSRSKTKIRRMAKYHPTVILRVFDAKWFSANQRNLRMLIPDWENKDS